MKFKIITGVLCTFIVVLILNIMFRLGQNSAAVTPVDESHSLSNAEVVEADSVREPNLAREFDTARDVTISEPVITSESDFELEVENTLPDNNPTIEQAPSINTDSIPLEATEPVINPEPPPISRFQPEIRSVDLSNSDFGLKVSLIRNEYLDLFDYVYNRDFVHPHGHHIDGYSLVLWADAPLFKFSLISIIVLEESELRPHQVFTTPAPLLPGRASIVVACVCGSFPTSGVMFDDGYGKRHHFWISQDISGGIFPNPSSPDFADHFVDGSVQITRMSDIFDDRVFTVTLDEIGNRDFEDWFWEYGHRWNMYTIRGFYQY